MRGTLFCRPLKPAHVVRGVFAAVTCYGLTMLVGLDAAHAEYRAESYVKGDEYVTPHFPWAKPMAGEPIEVLLIAPGTGSRNIWDLGQRIAINHTVFEVERGATGRFGTSEMFARSPGEYERRRSELNALLDERTYDVIVLGNIAWSSLPMDVIYRISAQAVRDGAGVIKTNAYFGDEMLEQLYKREPLASGFELFQPFPFEHLERGLDDDEFEALVEEAKADPDAEVPSPVTMLDKTVPYHKPGDRKFDLDDALGGYRVGEGRFVSLPFPFHDVSWAAWASVPSLIPGFPVNMRNLWQEEYYYMLLAKAVLWAADRQPTTHLTTIEPTSNADGQTEAIPAGEPVEINVGLAAREGEAAFEGTIRVDVRDSITGRYVGRAARDVTTDVSADGEVTFTIPVHAANDPDRPLRLASDAFVHVRLHRGDDGTVADFGAGFVQVESVPLEVHLDAETYEHPEPVGLELALAEPAEVTTLEIELYDSRGRIWERQTIDAPGSEVSASLPTDRLPLLAHGMRVTAYASDRPLGAEDAFFTLRRRRPPEDYYVLVADEPWATWHTLRRLERAYEWGVEGLRDHKPNRAEAVIANLAGLDSNPGRPHVPHELTLDPDQVDELENTGRTNSAIYRHFNQHLYNTTDDSGPQVREVHAPAIPHFVDWLRNESDGEIERLNAVWATDYASFDEITLDFVRGSRSEGHVPVWVDYCRFVNDTYIEAQGRYEGAIREHDPLVAVGTDAVYHDHSLASLYRHLSYMMPYYRPTDVEMARSMAKGDAPVYTGICMGYGTHRPRNHHEYLPWHILFAGNNSILYWSFSSGLYEDLVRGDTPGGYRPGWSMEQVAQIKLSGAGQFVNASERLKSGIAIHYSEASRRARDVDSPFAGIERRLDPVTLAFQEMLSAQGLAYHYVDTACIVEDGVLEDGSVELLILPHVQAMSEEEAERIATFVRGGGSVLADVRPAIRTHRGRRLEKGQLNEVFGIRRDDAETPLDVSVRFPGHDAAVPARADGAVQVDAGRARLSASTEDEDVPLFIEHNYGDGRAMLMNLDATFMDVGTRGDAESATAARASDPAIASFAFMAEVFEDLNIDPGIGASLDEHAPLGVTRTGFSHGDVNMLAVEVTPVTGYEYPQQLRIELDAVESRSEHHVVDMISGDTWRADGELTIDVKPYDVMLLALLEREPGALVISAPEAISPGQSLRVEVNREDAPDHSVLRFALIDPEGVRLRDYQTLETANGERVEGEIHLPYNCMPGPWKLEVSDLTTGRSAQHSVRIE